VADDKKPKKKASKKTTKRLINHKKTVTKELKKTNKNLQAEINKMIKMKGLITLTAEQKEAITDLKPICKDRNSSLTPEAIEATIFCIMNGVKKKAPIARYIGVKRETLVRWINLGIESDDPNDMYYQYVQMYNKAIQLYQLKHHMIINKKAESGDKDAWKASVELLDRAFPEDRVNKITDTQVEVAIGEKKMSKEVSEINEDKLRLVGLRIQQTFFDNLVKEQSEDQDEE
jgi:hypothetical protein